MNQFSNRLIRTLACLSLVASQSAQATKGSKGGGATGKTNSGNTFDCSKNPKLCTGNSGNGVGNGGPGNQGNDGTNGNTGPGGGSSNGNSNGNSNGGSTTGGSTTGGNTNGAQPPIEDTPPTRPPEEQPPAPPTPPPEEQPPAPPTPPTEEQPPVEDQPPVVDEKPANQSERSLAVRIRPLFYMDYDLGTGIIAVDDAKPVRQGAPNLLQMTRQASRYQKSSYELLEGGLGAALGFYFKNAVGVTANFWAQVGMMPMKGTEVASVRYFNSLAAAKATRGYKSAPLDVTSLYKWQVGDSVTYKSKGGLIYVGGTGFGIAGLSATKLAQGIWETYIEKVEATQVFVKITSTKLDALSNGAGVALGSVARTDFKNTDDGFSYLIELNSETGRKVYQDLVRGNVTAAQQIVEEMERSPELQSVKKVEKFKRKSKGEGYSLFFGVPIFLNATTSENHVQSHNMSDMFIDNSKVDAQFSVYDFTQRSRAFGTHTTMSKGFYGVAFNANDLVTGDLQEAGKFGRFSWVYQDDNSSMRTLHRNMQNLIDETGLEQFRVIIPNFSADMDFTNISLNITMTAENIESLTSSVVGRSARQMKSWSERRAKYAYAKKGVALCKTVSEQGSCENEFLSQTSYASAKMQDALSKMRSRSNKRAEFTKAFAEFGKAAMTNQETLAMALTLAGPGTEISFALEGTYFKAHRMSARTTNVEGRLKLVNPRDQTNDASLDPEAKRSRFHGVITNKNFIGLGSP